MTRWVLRIGSALLAMAAAALGIGPAWAATSVGDPYWCGTDDVVYQVEQVDYLGGAVDLGALARSPLSFAVWSSPAPEEVTGASYCAASTSGDVDYVTGADLVAASVTTWTPAVPAGPVWVAFGWEHGADPGEPTPPVTEVAALFGVEVVPPPPPAPGVTVVTGVFDDGPGQAVGLAASLVVFLAAAGFTRSFAQGARA